MDILVVISLFCVIITFVRWRLRRARVPFPPGPPGDPIIGHARIIPAENQGEYFYQLSKVYGPVIHLTVPGRTLVVLNTVEAAIDLLEKRSVNYSDRSRFVLFEIMGWNVSLAFLPYGKRFQKHRRLFQEYFTRKKCETYHNVQLKQSRILLRHLVKAPAKFESVLQWFTTSIIMHVAYGRQVTSEDDPFVTIAEEASATFSTCVQYMPSWFPGTYYAERARASKSLTDRIHVYPYKVIQMQMKQGTATPSFLSHHIEKLNEDSNTTEDDIDDIKGSAAMIYSAGGETTRATLIIFILAMVLYPECQIAGQKEIDEVLGVGKLPDFADRSSLPYVECILQESYRWNNAIPLGVPHKSMEDDVYNGMFIPKGSIMIANTRGMCLNENVYSEPYKFNPSRFLPKPYGLGEPYPVAHFGFGGRVCPGRHLADDSVWIAVASIIATLTVSKCIGKDGKEVTPDVEFTTGVTSLPKSFTCNIKPRNEVSEAAIISQTDEWNL
ncbi:cytochrome P450 [Crucibulum laeve]|uniref:Cytochrome P450 n=1 Tax=Crucibulum laeve TaxID=68775 RepID=A0A5C3LZ09_9AGAR|nr:cytochrome P450 [Crucibulum laeve]